jgi:hypothetical protein
LTNITDFRQRSRWQLIVGVEGLEPPTSSL